MTESTEAPKKTKPGYRTSEFWLTTAASTIGALMMSGAFEGGVAAKVIGAVATVLSTLGYTVARTKAKAVEAAKS